MTTDELILYVDDLYSWNPEAAAKLDEICDANGVDIYTAYMMLNKQ